MIHRGKCDRSQIFTNKKRSIEITVRGMLDSREKNDRSQNFKKRNAIDRCCLRGRCDSQREMRSIANFHKQKAIDRNNIKRDVGFQREKRSIVNSTLTFYDRSFRPFFIFLRFLKICFYYKTKASRFFSVHIIILQIVNKVMKNLKTKQNHKPIINY